MDDDELIGEVKGLREEIRMLSDRLTAILTAPDDRPLAHFGKHMFNVRHVVRAEFSQTAPMAGTLKIWFTSKAGLGEKPLTFKGKDGDFLWAYLKCSSDDASTAVII